MFARDMFMATGGFFLKEHDNFYRAIRRYSIVTLIDFFLSPEMAKELIAITWFTIHDFQNDAERTAILTSRIITCRNKVIGLPSVYSAGPAYVNLTHNTVACQPVGHKRSTQILKSGLM